MDIVYTSLSVRVTDIQNILTGGLQMVDNKVSGSAGVIDMKEIELTKEELERDYCDIKQVAQIFNNVSERTAYRYLDKVSDNKGIKIRTVEVNVNGGVRKLYLKEDVVTISKILNKDKTVLVYVHDTDVNDKENTDKVSDSLPKDVNGGQGVVKQGKDQELANINPYKDLTQLFLSINATVVEQGKVFLEKYYEDREERRKMEREQIDLQKQQLKAQQDLLAKITIPAKSQTNALIILAGVILIVALGYFGFQQSKAFINQLNEKDTKFNQTLMTFQNSLKDREGEIDQLKSKVQELETNRCESFKPHMLSLHD